MKKLIIYSQNIGISIGLILLINIIITVLQYFNLFSNSLNFFKLSMIVISIFIGAYKVGKKAVKKGYLEGIRFGSIMIILFLLINLLLFRSFQLKNIIYYFIILISSIVGAMFGIQTKKF